MTPDNSSSADTEQNIQRIDSEFGDSLLWGLERLAFYGELAQADGSDPQVRYEVKCHAKTAFQDLAGNVD